MTTTASPTSSSLSAASIDSAPMASAFTTRQDAAEAAREIVAQLAGINVRAVAFFCPASHDGDALCALLREAWPGADVMGCTTAGAFVDNAGSEDGISAFAFAESGLNRAAAALATFEDGVEAGVRRAIGEIEDRMRLSLRDADPSRYIGVVVVDGLRMHEEEVNRVLGNAAPLISFVGGSAGDNLAFFETRVFANGASSPEGAALLLLDMSAPFTIMKTCSFVPTEHVFTITKADVDTRTVYEVNGRPVLEAYAEAVGTTPGALDGAVFMRHPVGMMLDDEPWIRSPQQALPDGGLRFYCRIEEGMEVYVMRSTDLVGETRAAVQRTRDALAELSGRTASQPRGALVFNCILRRLELDALDAHAPFREAFSGMPMAGFHTYGESWLGHINQTCTGIFFA